MSAGYEVTKSDLDVKVAEAVLALRTAFDKVETVQAWLVNKPEVNGVDPLTEAPFSYTVDEVYLIRLVFGDFDYMRLNAATALANGRKLTGLS